MVRLSEKLQNPLILSVLISVLLIYSRFSKIPVKNPYSSVIKESKVKIISGEVVSSPSKTQNGKYYLSKVLLGEVQDFHVSAEATGIVNMYIPSEYIESFFPGRVYSEGKASSIVETGTKISCKGSFSNSAFFVTEVIRSDISEKNKIRLIRAKGRLKFKRMMFSWGKAGGLLLALLSGAREYTEDETSRNFRNAGLSHILALSGMHLSMFSGIALFFGNRIGRKKIALILQLLSISIFVWFAGFSPSLLRAFICISIILFQGIIAVEKSDMLTVLCFSFFIQTVISPGDLTNSGFILSYGALCGIVITGEFFRKIYGFLIPGKIADALSASTSAQIITLPASYKMFGMITPVGIISSVFVSPLITVFIYSGLLLILLGILFQPFVGIGEIIMNMQYNLISNLVGFFARIPPVIFE